MSQREEILQGVLASVVEKHFPRESKVKIKAINSAGANYTSALFEATIITPEGNEELFVKLITMAENFSASMIFEIERFVYSDLALEYERLQDKYNIESRYVFPKYYKYNDTDGAQTIVLENLASKGYDFYDRFDYIDWEYSCKSIETLAKFHALSLALKKENPEEFEKAGALKLPETSDNEEWSGLLDGALAAVNNEDREKVDRCLEGSVGWGKLLELYKPRKTAVIIHGDYRPSNLMHKVTEGKLHIIPVDYQMVRLGCPVSDLIYFVILGSDQQFRRAHFYQLIEHYYQQLVLALKRLGIEAEEVYGKEEFDSDLKDKLPYGICIAALSLPFVTVDPEDAPCFEKGRCVPRANELFAERFRALVDDYKEFGII